MEITKEEGEFAGEQHKATTENLVTVLKKGFEEYGKLDEILTDLGTQFIASR